MKNEEYFLNLKRHGPGMTQPLQNDVGLSF